MRRAVLALVLAAFPAWAQDAQTAPEAPPPGVSVAASAVLRGLDKVTGQTRDFELRNGESAELGRLTITAGECRYPSDDPASNAYAWVSIKDRLTDEPLFAGWMIASAPALNALDHPRYDVWAIRCNIAAG